MSRTAARLLATTSILLATPVLAQVNDAADAVTDEIIVTATKRATTLQEVPFSIAAVTQEDIVRTGANSLEDVSRNVAGLTIQNLGPGQSQVAVRGVSAGQIVRDQPGVKEQVGVYLDESVVSLSLFTPDLDLFDLNRVEALRGPQGTLFGSGSVGGTIRYITNQPNLSEAEGALEFNVNTVKGGGDGGHLKGAFNTPLIEDVLAFRAVGYWTQYAGFIDAIGPDETYDAITGNPQLGPGNSAQKDDINDGQRYGGRLALTWAPTDDLSITPRIIYQKIDVDGFNRQEVFNLFSNPFTTDVPARSFDEREQFLLQDEAFEDEFGLGDLTVTAGLGPNVELTSVTSVTSRDILVSRDASALTGSVSVDLGYPTAAVFLPSRLNDETVVQQFTQELRLSNRDLGLFDDRFDWLVGGFYADTERKYTQTLPTPGYQAATDATLGAGTSNAVAGVFGNLDSPFNSLLPYDLEQLAIFGEGTYAVTDRLDVTVGARYYDFEETRDITTGGLFAAGGPTQTDETSSDGISPRVIVDYEVTPAFSVNAQASKGFRLGGVNDPLNTGLCSADDLAIFGGFQDYGDETLWNYEVGGKYSAGGLRLNAAAFYTDISDLQATLDAGSCSSRIVFNVPDAHTQGVEAELTYNAGAFEVGASGSIIEAEFDSDVVDGTGAILAGLRDGNRLPSVPEFQGSAFATFYPAFETSWAANPYITASVQHIGSRFTQPSDQEPGAGEFVSNLPFLGAPGTDATNLDLELDGYTIFNLSAGFDLRDDLGLQIYATNLFDENANLSFDRERGGRARLAFRTNQPRTVGLTLRYTFDGDS